MKTEDRILKLLKEKQVEGEPGYMADLGEELDMPDNEMILVCGFLKKNGLITVDEVTGGVWITPNGVQLLNLPDLPEDELPSDQLEVLERHWGEEVDDSGDGRKWLFLMQLKNKISCELGRSQGAITVKQEGGNLTLTAVIPKMGGALHLREGDISKCHHTPEEVKMEMEKLRARRLTEEVRRS